ncbi:unnamed protein product [Camellia sinensis]
MTNRTQGILSFLRVPLRSSSRALPRSAKSLSVDKKKPLVVCFGEMLIDFVPSVAGVSLAEAPSFKKVAGGAPANVAVDVARLGGSSAFIGKVGEDEFGHMLANILKENNVDSSAIRFDANARTALAFITLRADGEREFMFFRHPSADMLLSETELDKDLIKKASIFHYGSIGLIEEPCRSTLLAATEIAKQSGCILSYDPNLRVPLWPSEDVAREGIMSIWNKADVIKVSEDEITFLTGNDDDAAIEKLYHPNLKLLIVTEGAGGCRYYTKLLLGFFTPGNYLDHCTLAFDQIKLPAQSPSYDTTKNEPCDEMWTFPMMWFAPVPESEGRVDSHKVDAVDTTGAGDAFVAGLLNSLASDPTLYKEEEKLREALVFANGCGALTVMEKGASPSLPTKEKVLKFLK